MKLSILFTLVLSVVLLSCKKDNIIEEIEENDVCSSFIPFYEQQDSNALSLSIECDCLDSNVNLNSKLMSYTDVINVNFNCDAARFNSIPTMPSVKLLSSNVTTGNVLAFPNLEVYRNKSYMSKPLAYQLRFLPNLREVILYNAVNFSDFIASKPLDVFKMTFQSTAEHSITLPNNIYTLTNLKELIIRDVELAIFTNYENLVSLEHLELSNIDRWVRIPETTNQWSKLKTLAVSNVELRNDIPDIFEDMDSLETVYFRETEISTNTQKHLSKAPNLKELTFSFCELGNIPEELGNLVSLEKLIITTEQNTINNPITLPLTIGNLSNLKSIFISTNSNQFPVSVFSLKNTLESLAIKDDIGAVPSEIGDFTALKELKLSNCSLTTLPITIQNLANILEKLYLTGNGFDEATKQQIEAWLPNTDIYF